MRPVVVPSMEDPTGGQPWGSSPVDPEYVANPSSEQAQAATQATQQANESARAAAAQTALPPPPLAIPMIGSDGRVSQAWVPWFTQLYLRSGGANVTPASDMDILTEFDDLPVPPRALDVFQWPEAAPISVFRQVLDDGLWDEAPSILAWVQRWVSSQAFTPAARTIATTAPLTGGGALTANLTLAMPAAASGVSGHLTAADWNTFNGKQAALGFTPANKAGDTFTGDVGITATTPSFVVNTTVSANWRGYRFQSSGTEIGSLLMEASGGEFRHSAGFSGFGGFHTFYTNGVLALTIDASQKAKFAGNVGFNGTSPIAKPSLNAAAVDAATNLALTNQIRSALINYGLCS